MIHCEVPNGLQEVRNFCPATVINFANVPQSVKKHQHTLSKQFNMCLLTTLIPFIFLLLFCLPEPTKPEVFSLAWCLYQTFLAFSNNFYFRYFDAILFDVYTLMTEFLNKLFMHVKLLFLIHVINTIPSVLSSLWSVLNGDSWGLHFILKHLVTSRAPDT